MNRRLNQILMFIAIIGGIGYGIIKITDGDFYSSLICFSIIPVMFVPYLLEKIFHLKFTNQMATIYYIYIFFAHFLGSILNFYYLIPGYDKVMHFLSGMLSAFIALILLVHMKHYKKRDLFFTILFVIAITLSIASLWEFYEFTFDNLFGKDAQNVVATGVSDTMWDMIMAFLGSIIVIILYIREVRRKKAGIVLKFIEEVGGTNGRTK